MVKRLIEEAERGAVVRALLSELLDQQTGTNVVQQLGSQLVRVDGDFLDRLARVAIEAVRGSQD